MHVGTILVVPFKISGASHFWFACERNHFKLLFCSLNVCFFYFEVLGNIFIKWNACFFQCLGVLLWTFECSWLCRLLIQMSEQHVINDTCIFPCLCLFNVIHNLTPLMCMFLPNMLEVFLSWDLSLTCCLFSCVCCFQQLDPKSCMHAGKRFSCLLIWQFCLLRKFMFGMLQTVFGNMFLFCVTLSFFCCCCWAFYLISVLFLLDVSVAKSMGRNALLGWFLCEM